MVSEITGQTEVRAAIAVIASPIFAQVGPSGSGSQSPSSRRQREDHRLSSAFAVEPVSLRCSQGMKKEQSADSLYVFPSPRKPGKPIRSVKRAWRTALKRAGVPYFSIYNLRHVFCTRLSWVAPDAVLQRAMRHSSPETKRHYQLGMVDQVREGIERANKRAYEGKEKVLRFYYGSVKSEKGAARTSVGG